MFENAEARQLKRIADVQDKILLVLIQIEEDLKQLIAPRPKPRVGAKIFLGAPVSQ